MGTVPLLSLARLTSPMPSFGLRGRSIFRGVPDPDAKSAMHEMRTIIFFMDYLIYGLWAGFLSFIFFADDSKGSVPARFNAHPSASDGAQ